MVVREVEKSGPRLLEFGETRVGLREACNDQARKRLRQANS